jgi:glutathione S-transferase
LLVFAEDSPYRSDAAAAPRLVSFSGPLRDKHNLLEPNHVPPFMLTLFHHPMLASCRFIRLTFGEHGEEIQLVEEMPWTRRPEFLALNPAGGLPVLLAEGDVPIVGAYAIAEYLDETRGILKRDKRLLAENPMDRAEIRRLIDWYLGKMETEVTRHLVRERVLKRLMPDGGGSPDSAAIRAARSNVKQHLKYTNWLAGTRNWLAGTRITYADLAAAASISVLDYLGEIDWTDHKAARDWYSRVKSRPSFRSLLNDRVRGLTPVAHYMDLDF